MITFESSGNFQKTKKSLLAMVAPNIQLVLNAAGEEGVKLLEVATPRDTGRAASSWGYFVEQTKRGWTVTWTNSDIENGFPVALMLQLGHGHISGGYSKGIDYINPALKVVFEDLANNIWKVVTSA